MRHSSALPLVALAVAACRPGYQSGPPVPPPAASCAMAPGGGHPDVPMPTMLRALRERGNEAWLGSPAVVDLDRDGHTELVIPRDERLVVWRADGTVAWAAATMGRIWAPPVVANFIGDENLEVVVASRGRLYMFDARGQAAPGFPVTWRDEMRAVAAGDVDGDGRLEIVVVTTGDLDAGGRTDIVNVFRADGSQQQGFPPNTTGTSGCDDACYVHAGFDQTLAVGPIDEDATWDLLVPQDNAYMSWHRGSGVMFEAASIFRGRTKVAGIRGMLDYALARQGYGDDGDNQMHWTNSAPAIADIDGNGTNDLVVLGSVQNVAQDDRFRGVALWVLNRDGTRAGPWVEPFHVPTYLAGLWDFEGTNVVGATNQVSIADLDPTVPGLDMVFAGFDGRIHLVGADRRERWTYQYTTANNVLTGGVVLADLSGDGSPEVVFSSYSPSSDLSALYVLNASGSLLHRIALPGRGAMPVPTVADVDGNGTLEIVVSLKDGDGAAGEVLIYTVPGSSTNCAPWPTGRGNYLRNGFFRAAR
jgi:hypothetical protein